MERESPYKGITWAGKFVLYYSLLIAAQALILNLLLKVSVRHLLQFVLLLIVPSLISGPLIYRSRRDPNKANAWLFIFAVEFHFALFAAVLIYAGFLLGYVPQSSLLALFVCFLLGSLITAVMLFRRIRSINERRNEVSPGVIR